MGTGKRGLLTAAVTVVCAVTVLAAPGTAFAAPKPTPSTSTSTVPGTVPGTGAAPRAGATPGAVPTPPPDKDLEKVRERLDRLYHDAAVATDSYNAAEERAKEQSARIVALAKKIVAGQRKLDRLKDQAGASARAQYRGGGLPPTAQFLLSDDPQQFLDGAGTVLNGQRATTKLIGEMTRTQQELREYADDASAQWRKLDANRKAKAVAKKKIKRQIAEAEQLESRLEKKQKERLAELERQAAYKAQTQWLDTGILKEIDGKASQQGRKAVAFATAQLGKPYVWGAEGPDSFDCSGLTSQAWADAGHPIPRTSQEQWRQLKHVDVKDMRPGDLIIYFDDASHVAMYVGDGAIIHAPRPGRTVTVAGAGTMPILGVVRPDA
ncbi:C40 family peptidase [Streptomyces collinus]|uniref:NLP/P60-family secreted protein n=1 Tax=Streptomyces collinus (strain DSM 40733 / Tue 365) TaxID=1214242 RepID=S5VIQ5_STRC3|nr:NlpC/P60 family protein [Streptomyces collinus]AGS70387.1 NLP/P60-family secreted protein [Streptomyces collinus Tu 365]UJA09030.1 NLP/P60-family secreted protein [Streptomyces collinus]UJA16106.1 NLP/P60-family secreted protein [Streptomyces collinus]